MKTMRLLDVCDVYQPQTIATKYFVPDGKYTVYGANGVIGKYNKYNHENQEVLMACRGATCGAINVSEPFSWINGNAMVIHPNGTVALSKEYLKYYLMSASKDSIISGTAQPQITRQNLKDFQIVICDLDTQQQIVSYIEESLSQLDSAVETLKKTKQQLEVYRLSALKDVFMKSSPMIPFKTITESRLGKMLDKEKNTGIMREYLRNINVRWFDFDLSDLLEMRIEDKETDKYSIEKGDLVICEGGEPGRCAVWESEDTMYYQKALHRVRFTDGSNPKYYMYYLWFINKTGALSKYFTGTGIKHLTGQSLAKVPVPSISVQQQNEAVSYIEDRFYSIDQVDKIINQSLVKAESLRQSILKQVFKSK